MNAIVGKRMTQARLFCRLILTPIRKSSAHICLKSLFQADAYSIKGNLLKPGNQNYINTRFEFNIFA